MSDTSGTSEVEIRGKDIPTKLSGGVVIDGFPSLGFASTISSACLVSSLNLSPVGDLRSDLFPPLATVSAGRLEAPARIYVDIGRKLAIFLGNFSPEGLAAHATARAIIRWAKERECSLVVTSVGLPLNEEEEKHTFMGVGNNKEAEELLRKAGIPLADLAAIGGLSGSLLLKGREEGIPVVALMVKTHEGLEDFEAGVKVVQLLASIVPSAQCETEDLREEARRTEQALKRLKRQADVFAVYR